MKYIQTFISLPITEKEAFLMLQQGTLDFQSGSISGQSSGTSHHPVTRNHYQKRIVMTSPAYRTDRLRRTDGRRHLSVGTDSAIRNILQRLPDT